MTSINRIFCIFLNQDLVAREAVGDEVEVLVVDVEQLLDVC